MPFGWDGLVLKVQRQGRVIGFEVVDVAVDFEIRHVFAPGDWLLWLLILILVKT